MPLYPVNVDLHLSANDIDTYQVLTDMYFKGVINGEVILSITAKGTQLLFTNDQDVTYVELDNSVIEDYKKSVTALVKKLNSSIFDSAFKGHHINHGSHYFGDPNAMSISTIATNNIANWSSNSGTA